MANKLLPILLIFVAVLVLYRPSFSVYFSQDDFFQFKASLTDGSVGQFINLFGFPSFNERGYAFYRPIFREGLHNLYYSVFGLNSFPMHVLSWILHFSNITLVFLLLVKILRKKSVAFLTALFYGVSTPNVALLNYLAGGVELSGATFFVLLSSIFFLKFLNDNDGKYKFLSFVFFILALASQESAAVTPILLAGLIFVKLPFKKFVNKSLIDLSPYLLILTAYLYLDAVKIGFLQTDKQYQVVFSLKGVLNSLSWYTVWALGLPEMLIDFVRPGLKLNPSLMRHWGEYFRIIFASFFVSVFVIGFSFVITLAKNKKILLGKKFWFLVLWFLVSIAPVILLPLHKSTHYLSLSLLGYWGAVWYLIFSLKTSSKKLFKMITIILFISLGVLSTVSVTLGNKLYWAAARGRLAEKLINDVKSTYPNLPKGSIVYFENDPNYPFVAEEWGNTSKQAAFILNNEDALQLYFKDLTLQVYYEDLGGVPNGLSPINTVVAKITQ